jgi:hypothetical protein
MRKDEERGFSLVTKAKELVANNPLFKNIVFNLMVEEKMDDENVVKFRESKCNKCIYKDGSWCGACGCVLKIKQQAKTNRSLSSGLIEVTHCYKGFWNDEKIALFYGHN